MHDHKKVSKVPLAEEQKAEQKAENEHYQSHLKAYSDRLFDQARLDENTELLNRVPQAYTLYNYRREIIQHLWSAEEEKEAEALRGSGGSSSRSPLTALTYKAATLKTELKLNSQILKQDYKIYSAFVHRRWIAEEWMALAKAETEALRRDANAPLASPTALEQLLYVVGQERRRCEELLLLDERNFHVWNYWRWAMGIFHQAQGLAADRAALLRQRQCSVEPAPADDKSGFAFFSAEEQIEMDFTTEKINQNFSNYSAWHQRALTLTKALARWGPVLSASDSNEEEGKGEDEGARAAASFLHSLLQRDLYLLTKAMYCDPNDQSAWFYAPFIVDVFERYRTLLLRHRATAATAPQTVEAAEEEALAGRWGGQLTEALVDSVLALVAEETRLGEEGECYFPLYFLCTLLMRGGRGRAPGGLRGRLAQHAVTINARLYGDRSNCDGEGGTAATVVKTCVRNLTQQLARVDPMRRGMYESFWCTCAEAAAD